MVNIRCSKLSTHCAITRREERQTQTGRRHLANKEIGQTLDFTPG
jgi:DNA-binding CsgD family transcriptional regulator